MEKYKIARLYDYCTSDEDYKKQKISSRSIKCKYRIHTGIGVSILSVILILVSAYLTDKWWLIASFITINWFWFLYMMRMGLITKFHIRKLNNMINKKEKTILDKVIIFLNEYNHYLDFHTKFYFKTKRSPLTWFRYKIVFRDEKSNYYYYFITNKKLKFRIKFHSKNMIDGFEGDYVVDLHGLSTVKQFQTKLNVHFLCEREKNLERLKINKTSI